MQTRPVSYIAQQLVLLAHQDTQTEIESLLQKENNKEAIVAIQHFVQRRLLLFSMLRNIFRRSGVDPNERAKLYAEDVKKHSDLCINTSRTAGRNVVESIAREAALVRASLSAWVTCMLGDNSFPSSRQKMKHATFKRMESLAAKGHGFRAGGTTLPADLVEMEIWKKVSQDPFEEMRPTIMRFFPGLLQDKQPTQEAPTSVQA
jgi:hypothetical protein